MTYIEFIQEHPELYGQIYHKNKWLIGSFKYGWNYNGNYADYTYHSETGKRGRCGFTLRRAFELFKAGRLTVNPEHGKKESYC